MSRTRRNNANEVLRKSNPYKRISRNAAIRDYEADYFRLAVETE